MGSLTRTVISFDYGLLRIGVAVGQELIAVARPLTTLTRRVQQPDWDAIDELIAHWQPDLLVVGLPQHADGSLNSIAKAALRFAQQLHDRYRLAVETIDEHLSTREAKERITKGKSFGRRLRHTAMTLDQVAAAVILETWFNQTKQRNNPRATAP
jgi:putative Holliday junction resolvase